MTSRKALHRVFAVAFMVFLLFEWGSHSLAFAHAAPPEGVVAVSSEDEHEDPCKTLIRCSDGRRQDQVPNLGHDGIQKNFSNCSAEPVFSIGSITEPDLSRKDAHRLFRPIDPPFHPPELS